MYHSRGLPLLRGGCCLIKSIFGAAAVLAAISLSPGSAQALVVTVNSVQYDVTTFTGPAEGPLNAVKFNTQTNGGMMPWYGNGGLAIDFALAVQGFFGNRIVCAADLNLPSQFVAGIFWDTQYGTQPTPVPCLDSYTGGGTSSAAGETYAVATELTPVSVPGPLPLFGVGAAFIFSRKLRKRIKSSTNAVSTTYSL